MLQWISANSGALTVVANVTMVAVWLIYLQLFWKSYRRQLRANILITPGAGTGLEARCLISNMSAEAVHIEAVFLVLEKDGNRWSTALTTLARVRGKNGGKERAERAERIMHEGPLAAGAYVDIGEFGDLLDRAREALQPGEARGPASFDAFEIWAIGDYSTERRLVSVRRRFAVTSRNGRVGLRPDRIRTEQVRGGKRRRQLERMIEEHISGLSA